MNQPQGVRILRNEPLRRWTGFKIGGPADYLCLPRNVDQLLAVIRWANAHGQEITYLGGGYNILASDKGVRGVVVVLKEGFDHLVQGPIGAGRVRIIAGAGVSLARLVAMAGRDGWADLTFLAGIPGTTGGALVMNAGAWGGSMEQVIERLTLVNGHGQPRELAAEELEFSYRFVRLPQPAVVVEMELISRLADPTEVSSQIKASLEARRRRQPTDRPSAGSFFKNPPGDYAGRLIEAAGLKGERVGEAMVSPVHANFIVNLGQATAEDVLTLASLVRDEVKARFGVELEPEVRFIGEGRERWPWLTPNE